MKKITPLIVMFFCFHMSFSQDILMQNGSFNQCSGVFFDSGGASGNYGDNEDFVITICPDTPDKSINLNFTSFSIQLNREFLTFYDGDSDNAPLIATFTGGGLNNPGLISASATNTTGCITVKFTSDATATTIGWAADIFCCQKIAPVITTIPAADAVTGIVQVVRGTSLNFDGSATLFPDTNTGATYQWDFGDGTTANGEMTDHIYNATGTYIATLTVNDGTPPPGCLEVTQITIRVLDTILFVNGSEDAESSFTPQQLIEDVLVSGGCAPPDNFSFQVSGSPTSFNTKSYGYFRRGGALNFPFEEGIILTTGRAAGAGNVIAPPSIPGNILSSFPNFENGMPGDADLETALGQTETFDATFIKFNFVATENTISFRYIMASEEYDGIFECNFSDSFAFLLREAGTTAYTNLAVLPDNTPVSVTNINNPDPAECTASNPDFFAGFNIGDTNYEGRTVVLTASAPVVAGTTYEIKLVVADQNDDILDSAVFLEAGSFNLGGDLGDDITIAAGTAVCQDTPITLDSGIKSVVTHTWSFEGTIIPGETGSTIDVTQTGNYSVAIDFAAGCTANDDIFVEFIGSPSITSVTSNTSICSGENAIFTIKGEPGNIVDYAINRGATMQVTLDATGTGTVTNTNVTTDQTISLISVMNPETSCMSAISDTVSVTIIEVPIVNPLPLAECEDITMDGGTLFNLTEKDNEVTASNPNYAVSYYTIAGDELIGTTAASFINMPAQFRGADLQTIYVRIDDAVTNCFATTKLVLRVLNPPAINSPEPITNCSLETSSASIFDLTINETSILNGTTGTITYHASMSDAEKGVNAIVNPVMYESTSALATIFVRVTNPEGCFSIVQFDIIITSVPNITALNISELELIRCEIDRNSMESFDLTENTPKIEAALTANGQNVTDFDITYYESMTDVEMRTNPITTPGNYTNTSNPQIIYVNIMDRNTSCDLSTVNFEIEVQNGAVANTPLLEYAICANIPNDELNTGFARFNLSSIPNGNYSDYRGNLHNEILNGLPTYPQSSSDFTITFYSTMTGAAAGSGHPDQIPENYQNTTPNEQTIFIRVDNDTRSENTCFDISEMILRVLPLPVFDLDENYFLCKPPDGGPITNPPVIDTGLSISDYTFTWFLDNEVQPQFENLPNISPTQSGVYSVLVMNRITGCDNLLNAEDTYTTTVNNGSTPTITARVASEPFASNNVIVATATGSNFDLFEFRLDDGPWVKNTPNNRTFTFTNVSPGDHQVFTRSVNGCGTAMIMVTVIDFPLFFTPNNDGFHDTWNITSLNNQNDSKIYIFDRFGKLLNQLRPSSGLGWDGTYNGKLMPSSDYWFVVEYEDPNDNKMKQFRGHFSLIR